MVDHSKILMESMKTMLYEEGNALQAMNRERMEGPKHLTDQIKQWREEREDHFTHDAPVVAQLSGHRPHSPPVSPRSPVSPHDREEVDTEFTDEDNAGPLSHPLGH